jgi:chaperonin GroEL
LAYIANEIKQLVDNDIEVGIVIGGGMALYRIAGSIDLSSAAGNLVFNVIRQPVIQILQNAEEDAMRRLLQLSSEPEEHGYNVVTRKFENFIESGVIDPVKVTKSAVKNSFAMGMQIITADAAVVVKREKTE